MEGNVTFIMNRLRWKQIVGLAFLAACLAFSLAGCQRAPAKISGKIELISNNAATFPPVEVRLMDTRRDQNDPRALIGQVQTDATGHYEFTNLKPGTYSLGLTSQMPAGRTCSPPSYTRIEQWLVAASYATNAQGQVAPTLLQAVLESSIEAESGADLQFDLQIPVPCE